MSARILVVDDDPAMCALLVESLQRRRYRAIAHTRADEAFAALAAEPFDVVVTDLNMPGLSGVDLCRRIVQNWPNVPVVLITAFGSLETAIGAIRAGAYDFITKPLEVDELALTVERALQHRALREEVKRLQEVVRAAQPPHELLGDSPAMRAMFDLIARVAESDAAVLITGESGTGKELVARALHRRSRRAAGPFVAVNCAAVPATLLESELFGHLRGAFTDATANRPGLFTRADGGSVFLDEVGELPLELQPKLLRALQERTVRPLGADTEVAFDARLIAASNRDLEAAVDAHRFREDLFYRLNVVHIDVPPLRARRTDVLLLAQHFLADAAPRARKQIAGLSCQAAERLLGYAWPGNVRELQNCIERAVVLTRCEQIIVDDLPERIRSYRRSDLLVPADDPADLPSMEEVERRYVVRVMEVVGGNKTAAARVLGFDRKTLYRKLERYGVAASDDDG